MSNDSLLLLGTAESVEVCSLPCGGYSVLVWLAGDKCSYLCNDSGDILVYPDPYVAAESIRSALRPGVSIGFPYLF